MSSARYLVWLLLLAAASVLSCGYHVECQCVEEERLALQAIKAYMKLNSDSPKDDNPWFDGGEADDCCEWDGINCNVSTGRVTDLYLNAMVFRDEDHMIKRPWMFNVTLLFRLLTQLVSLDLSDNNSINGLVEHDGSTKISTLKNLQVLDLSGNFLEEGFISLRILKSLRRLTLISAFVNKSSFLLTLELPSLTELRALDLGSNDISNHDIQGICKLKILVKLHRENNLLNGVLPPCFKNLSSLQSLDLSRNNLNGKFPKMLSSFSSLEYLDLSHNYLEGKFSLTSLANLSRLQVLLLSGNMLEVEFLEDQPKFQLQSLGLGGCNLNKTFEAFHKFWSHQTNISELDISNNNLLQAFPVWLLHDSTNLRVLSLANNSFTGNLRLPHAATLSLQILDISNNNFHDRLPENIGFVFPRLKYLNLSHNHFEGPIPTSISNMRELQFLDFSNNKFSGEVPRRLFFDCNSIISLDLSNNKLEGDVIIEDMNLPSLYYLKLSNNRFGGTLKDALLKSSDSLYYVDLSNNTITGIFPSWIGNLTRLFSLSLSQNNLQGYIPMEICNLDNLQYLDLSQNNFSGSIPSCYTCSFKCLHLHNNSLSGMIPNALSNCTRLHTLDLRDNQLSGGIPLWINKLSDLTILMLGENNLHGLIPQELCQLGDLNILDLSQNSLFGGIPICIGNLSFGMNTTNIDEGYFQHLVPWDTLAEMQLIFSKRNEVLVEFLNKNQLLSYKGRNVVMMSLLDLSSNKLTGNIPPQLGTLEQIHTLNLSHNFLSGSIPSQFSNLKHVESLDLSFNHLSGRIPSLLVELYFVEIFNVSYNNLSGRVPNTGQFASFDESNYYGNPELYGYYQITKLPPNTVIEPDENEGDDDHAGDDIVEFLWSFSIACVIMFLATIAILYINPQWRRAWFEFVDYHILWRFLKFRLNLY